MINSLSIKEKVEIINNRINNIKLSINDANDCLKKEQSQEIPDEGRLNGYNQYLQDAQLRIIALNKELVLLTENQ